MTSPARAASAIDFEAALRRLGYESFRPGQREAVETLMAVGRLLLVAPTGGGKSLSYQLPAVSLPGTTLVISPLVALMNDQVQALTARGVSATFLASTLDGDEVRRRMARMSQGQYSLVYVAPERLAFPGFRGLLHAIEIPLVAIDEAHCISEWGHDFRPEYLEIGSLLSELPAARVLACTATATPVVRDEILSRLGLPVDTPQHVRGFARPNLRLRATEVDDARGRLAEVDALLAEALGRPDGGQGVAIVYAPTRRGAEEEAERLAHRGWRTAVYHAGLGPDAREKAQRAFLDGRVEVMVATNAFGMGIDRADVRAVVHLGPPGSIEAYYQEVGRAGRDGAPAWGLLIVSPSDMPRRRRLLESDAPGEAVLAHKWGLFLELMRWAEGGSCRHDAILRYFGDEAEALDGCGQCDVCETLEDGTVAEQVTLIVRKALSAVARVHQRYGLTAAVKLLAGLPDPRLERAGLDRTPTFGNLKGHSDEWLTRVLRRCVTAGWVDFTPGDRPVVLLTGAGRAVMKGERPARLVLPREYGRGLLSPPAGRLGARAPEGPPAPKGSGSLPPEAAVLFEALRRLRLELAREDGVPPFVVASDRTLRDVAVLRPRTLDELQQAHGIGRAKAERYGKRLLEAVAERDPGGAGDHPAT
ncbi:MAG TPA: ATP-dependent DNA helicase RecQ [Vicinamibacteria bacterium]|nr:ATP-dependent DNA helicase RecQ [Vicinamibacteria bacterium]